MTAANYPHSDDSRVRGARTKRDRTRRALLDAAEALFDARGWELTRVDDVAVAAGVSTATAYNHFPSKHGLIGAVYAPYVHTLRRQAADDLATGRPVVEAVQDQVRALARLSARHRGLTAAFTGAVLDYQSMVNRAPDPTDLRDPRTVAPLPEVLHGLLVRGQSTGELRPHPAAYEIATSLVNLLMLRSINRPDETPETTAELLLTILFGTLRPEELGGPTDRPFARP